MVAPVVAAVAEVGEEAASGVQGVQGWRNPMHVQFHVHFHVQSQCIQLFGNWVQGIPGSDHPSQESQSRLYMSYPRTHTRTASPFGLIRRIPAETPGVCIEPR